MSSKRIIELDVARAFAMLYIVGFWHLKDYLFPNIKEILTFKGSSDITNIMLGSFMFISGILLSKYKFENAKAIVTFLKKRIKRFYLLYCIATLLFYISGIIPNVKLFLTTIFGVSTYILPQPYTLWFLSMLSSFYVITPLVGYLSQKIKVDCILIYILIYLTLFFLNGEFIKIDTRFFYCFPAYFIGLKLKTEIIKDINIRYLLLALPLYAILLYMRYKGYHVHYTDVLCGVFLFLVICKYLSGVFGKNILTAINLLSYASMCMYLFHRLIYGFIRDHFTEYFSLYIAILVLFVVFLISYFIQKVYDQLRYVL